MKQENFEKPDLLLKQVENVEFLLGDVIPWMEANPDRVDLNEYESGCGTYACLKGWYSKMRYGDLSPLMLAVSYVGSNNDEFGIRGNIDQYFGGDIFGTLSDRKTRLLAHKETLQTKITAWYSEREIAGVMV